MKINLKKVLWLALILTWIFIFIHFNFFRENYSSFGNPISPPSRERMDRVVNEKIEISSITSVLVKNISINFVSPLTFLNENLYNLVIKIHYIIHHNVNDPAINLNDFFEKYSTALSESTSGNLSTMIMLMLALLIIVKRIFNKKDNLHLIYYMVCLFSGFILFICIIKFQAWNARLQLPFFILAVAPISILLSDFYLKRKIIYYFLIFFCLFTALPFIYLNYAKSIISYTTIRKIFNKPPSVLNAVEFDLLKSANKSLLNYYEFKAGSGFLNWKKLNSNEKRNAISVLDSLNYFNNEKSILVKSRNESYLAPGFENFNQILSSFEQTCNYLNSTNANRELNIGLAGGFPEYPFMAMLRDYPSKNKIQWEHIRYIRLKHENENFTKPFYYSSIITSDSNFVNQFSKPVKNIRKIGMLTVIELATKDSTKYRME